MPQRLQHLASPVQAVVRPNRLTVTALRPVRRIRWELGGREPEAPTRAARKFAPPESRSKIGKFQRTRYSSDRESVPARLEPSTEVIGTARSPSKRWTWKIRRRLSCKPSKTKWPSCVKQGTRVICKFIRVELIDCRLYNVVKSPTGMSTFCCLWDVSANLSWPL